MTLVLGVEGGDTETWALLANDQGQVLGVGRAGSAAHRTPDMEGAASETNQAGQDALSGANVQARDIDLVVYALCSANLAPDFAVLEAVLADLALGRAWILRNSAFAALRSGTNNPNAVAVVLGSGSGAVGRSAQDGEVRLPALGWQSGDWGGDDDLAREALRLAVRAADGRGSPTSLLPLILETLHLSDVDDLIVHLHTQPIDQAQLVSLAALVFAAAATGDQVARSLVTRQGEEVAITALALLHRLDLMGADADVVLSGRVFRAKNPLLLDVIADRIGEAAPDARLLIPEVEPVVGAVLIGLDHLGVQLDTVQRQALDADATRVISGVSVPER